MCRGQRTTFRSQVSPPNPGIKLTPSGLAEAPLRAEPSSRTCLLSSDLSSQLAPFLVGNEGCGNPPGKTCYNFASGIELQLPPSSGSPRGCPFSAFVTKCWSSSVLSPVPGPRLASEKLCNKHVLNGCHAQLKWVWHSSNVKRDGSS